MRQPLIAANWKMNGTCQSIRKLLDAIIYGLESKAEVLVFPPSVYIQQVRERLCETSLKWGLQDISDEGAGAFTGEISSLMARDLGCEYVLIGHSERRTRHKESDQDIALKFCALVDSGITPILCVGESQEERESGDAMKVIASQLECVLEKAGSERLHDFVVAYEPVWAIGTGLTAKPDQAQDVHASIRLLLSNRGDDIAQNVRILYGGSMKASNAIELMVQPDVDGGLIGGASLVAEDFKAICHAAG